MPHEPPGNSSAARSAARWDLVQVKPDVALARVSQQLGRHAVCIHESTRRVLRGVLRGVR
jgi:hypothetical protein